MNTRDLSLIITSLVSVVAILWVEYMKNGRPFGPFKSILNWAVLGVIFFWMFKLVTTTWTITG